MSWDWLAQAGGDRGQCHVCGGNRPAMARADDFRRTGEQEAWDHNLDAGTKDSQMLFQALGFNLQAKRKHCMFQRWKLT